MSGFKDMEPEDRARTFLDLDFFGQIARIEGKPVSIMRDDDALQEMQSGQDLAVAESATLFFARSEDLPPRRPAGHSLNVNGRECLIDKWTEEMGISVIVLRENIVM